MDCSTSGLLSLTISWSLPKFMSIELVMPSSHLILCCPLLLLVSSSARIQTWQPHPSSLFLTIIVYCMYISSWQIDGETMETVTDFILGGSKITADGDCNHEIKRRLLLGRKAKTNLDSILKSRDIILLTNLVSWWFVKVNLKCGDQNQHILQNQYWFFPQLVSSKGK